MLDRTEQYLEQIVPGELHHEALNGMIREIHSLKGNAGILNYEDVVERSGEFETIIRRMADGMVGVTRPTIALLHDELDEIRRLTEAAATRGAGGAHEPPTGVYLDLAEDLSDRDVTVEIAVDDKADADERTVAEDQAVTADRDAVDQRRAPRADREEEDLTDRKTSGATTVPAQSVRVPTERLDRLFELVGELITAESMVLNSPDLSGLDLQVFRKRSTNLVKLTREMHEVALEVRMIPLQGTFQKMKRLARDVARRVGKSVELEIIGGDTEMDKTVIEKISDPLVHIIRNAIDHGLEETGKRLEAGKNETGLVRLSAGYEGKEIVITVADDGGGIDRETILGRAQAVGLVSNDGSGKSDREVQELIFEPGFSTRDAVSDVSGRGVGMDVVRTNVEEVRGRIVVESTPGRGTSISMFIPITLAIIDTVTVRIARQAYSIDLTDVQEFIELDKVSIEHTTEGREMVNLRDRMVPLVDLQHVLSFHKQAGVARGRTGIILAAGEREFCVPLDEIVGTQQTVVKSLPDYVGSVRGLAGMSIMPDGKVTFILDVRALVQHLFMNGTRE